MAASSTVSVELWAGHQVTIGRKSVPLLGRLETRTDTFVLAEIRRSADRIDIVERSCGAAFRPVAGVRLRLSDAALRTLPPAEIAFVKMPGRDPEWRAGPWESGWDAQDRDRDGHPGLAIQVDAPLCGGTLHLTSTARSRARGWLDGDALHGELRVELAQRVLEIEGVCLSALASDEGGRLTGRFRYERVPAGTTCETVAAWPVVRDDDASDPGVRARLPQGLQGP